MPATDREIWQHFRGNSETPTEVDFLAYAIYTYEKYDWIEEFERRFAVSPGQAEIENWIGDITPRRLETMSTFAVELFDNASRRYLADEIELQKKNAVDDSILAEVKAASSFWKQITLALITSILAPLIIGAVIVAAGAFDRFYPTATDVTRVLPLPVPAPTAPTSR